MRKQGLKLVSIVAAALVAGTAAHADNSPLAPIGAAASPLPISPWMALAAYSNPVVDENRLCYWDERDHRWIAADSNEAVQARQTDPRPVFREPNRKVGRCGPDVPVADLAGMGAAFGAFVYIASIDRRESISPD